MTQPANTNETPSASLARTVAPLDDTKAAIVRAAFAAMFARVEEWQQEARNLTVTSVDQVGKMQRARSLRLEAKKTRVEADKRRKAMKAGIILEGRAIDGAYAIFESLCVPLEQHLLEQETFADRAEAARRDALRSARHAALLALDVAEEAMPGALGEMSEEAWETVVANAKAAKEALAEARRREEAARAEAARILAEQEAARRAEAIRLEGERLAREEEQRRENERLRREAEEHERVLAEERRVAQAERERLEAAAQAERDKADAERRAAEADRLKAEEAAQAELKAERDRHEAETRRQIEAAQAIETRAREEREEAERALAEERRRTEDLQRREEERQREEAEARKPTKAKYALLIKTLEGIAANTAEPIASRRAHEALVAVGERKES